MPPLTHTLNLVTIDGRDWIADAGFGGSFSPPLPVDDGAQSLGPDGTAHRLIRQDERTWMLERAGDPGATDGRSAATRDWQAQYSFTLDPVEAIDLELSNHWTATRPDTRFTTLKIGLDGMDVPRLIIVWGGLPLGQSNNQEKEHGGNCLDWS